MKWIIIILMLIGYAAGIQKLSGLAMSEMQQLANVYVQAGSPDKLLSYSSQNQADLGFVTAR